MQREMGAQLITSGVETQAAFEGNSVNIFGVVNLVLCFSKDC